MLFEKLPEQEVRLINSYIDDYGVNPGSHLYSTREPLNHLLRYWDEAKSNYLYDLLNNSFILEKRVSYSTPLDKTIEQIGRSMTSGAMRPFYHEFHKKMMDLYPYCFSDEFSGWSSLCAAKSLARNSLEGYFYQNQIILEFENSQKVKLEQTTKPLRALGKIAKILGLEDLFEEFRLEHSRILNQKKLEGTLCLSIHPMDYMTMSDNASKWNSCMKWVNAGSYRMGTVEMMNSPCVVVAYLKSDSSKFYDWNDKHWRTLFVVHEEILTSIKSYPYACDELTCICAEWLKDLAAENLGWSFGPIDVIEEESTFKYGNDNWYYFVAEAHQMYNDFGCAMHWGALPLHLPASSTEEEPYKITVCYSGHTECMCCGRLINNSYDESYVFCDSCCSDADYDDDSRECDECGQWWSYDDMYYVEGNYVCPDCVDDVAAVSIHNGEYYYLDSLEKIYLASREDNTSEDGDRYCYFPSVKLSQFESAFYDLHQYCNITEPRKAENGLLYFNREDMNPKGLDWWFNLYSWDIDKYFESK